MKSIPKLRPCLAIIGAFALVVLACTAWAQSPSSDSAGEGKGPINTMCPVMTDEPVDPRFTAEYNGTTIGLCCRKCLTEFESDPAAYIANIPGLSTAALVDPDALDDAGGHDDQHVGHEHKPLVEADTAHAELESLPHPENTGESRALAHDDEHDHASDHDSGAKLFAWLGKFHPPSTHLPIGLLIGAAVAECLLILTRRDLFRHASAYCVVLATIGALSAATLGWINGGFVFVDDDWVRLVHRWLGTGTAVLSLVTGLLLLRASRACTTPRPRTAYQISLFATTALVCATGFFGGALVYGLSHYALP